MILLQNEDLSEQIADMEDKNSTLQKQKKKVCLSILDKQKMVIREREKAIKNMIKITNHNSQAESDNETLKKNVGELESTIKKQESEKQSKDHQIRSLQVCQ